MVFKQRGRACIVEGKSCDDMDSDKDIKQSKYALMTDSTEASPQSSQVFPADMSTTEYMILKMKLVWKCIIFILVCLHQRHNFLNGKENEQGGLNFSSDL